MTTNEDEATNEGQTSGETKSTTNDDSVLGGGTPKDDKGSEGEKSKDEGSKASEDEGAKGAGKEGDDPEGAPDEYEKFEMPEGFEGEVDEAFLEAGTEVFKELNLTQEQAQKLVGLYAEKVQEQSEAVATRWQETRESWVTSAKEDEEIGGDNWDDTLAVAGAVMSDEAGFATPELRELMNQYGIGDNPEVIKFVTRVGKTMDKAGLLPKQDQAVPGRPNAPRADRATRMYPSMKE